MDRFLLLCKEEKNIFSSVLDLYKLKPINEKEILNWFLEHPDATLVTDKLDDALIISKVFKKIENNLIIELFTDNSINKALSNNISKILISHEILWRNKFSKKYLKKIHFENS